MLSKVDLQYEIVVLTDHTHLLFITRHADCLVISVLYPIFITLLSFGIHQEKGFPTVLLNLQTLSNTGTDMP